LQAKLNLGSFLNLSFRFLNFINLTAEVSSKFYKLRKPAESNFISKQSETLPRRKYDKPTELDYILKIQKRCSAVNPASSPLQASF